MFWFCFFLGGFAVNGLVRVSGPCCRRRGSDALYEYSLRCIKTLLPEWLILFEGEKATPRLQRLGHENKFVLDYMQCQES